MLSSRVLLGSVFIFAALASMNSTAFGQSPNDIGVRPEQSYDGDHESIGLANGNLNISVPLVTSKARGGKALPISLSYNSSTWSPSLQAAPGGGVQWVWVQPSISPLMSIGTIGWQLNATNLVPGYLSGGSGASNSYQRFQQEELNEQVVTNYDQNAQPFYSWVGTDDGGNRSLVYQGGPVLRYLFPDGSQYMSLYDPANLSHFKSIDRNGNATDFISTFYNVNNGTVVSTNIIDSTGRTYQVTSQESPDVNGATITSSMLTYSETNGSVVQVQMIYGVAGTVDDGTPVFTNPIGSPVIAPTPEIKASMLSAIILPNGLTYTFHYNQYLELTKIGYPAGGYTRFEYTPYAVQGVYYINAYQGTPGYTTITQDYRQVSARYTCQNSQSGYKQTSITPGNTCTVAEQKTSYTATVDNTKGANQSNLVTYPDQSSVQHIFFPSVPGDCHSVTPVSYNNGQPLPRCSSPDLATITKDSSGNVVASTTAVYGNSACPISPTETSSVIGADVPVPVGSGATTTGYVPDTSNDQNAMIAITDYAFDGQTVTLPDLYSNVSTSTISQSGMSFDLCHVTSESHYASGTPSTSHSNRGANLAFTKTRSWVSSGTPQNTLGQVYGVPATGDYATPWLPDLILSEQTKDPQGNTVASTTYAYDQYNALGQSGIQSTSALQHGAPGFTEPYCTVPQTYAYQAGAPSCSGGQNESTFTVASFPFNQNMVARGNITKIDRLASTPSNLISTFTNYDDTGNSTKIADAAGNITSMSFQDAFAQTSCSPGSGQMNAYLSSTTSPTGLPNSYTYNSCDGSIASSLNPNQELVRSFYDFMGRPTAILEPQPDGGATTNCFSDMSQGNCSGSGFPLTTTTATQIDSSTTTSKQSFLDGLGRAVETTSSDPYGSFYSWIDYDVMGRPSTAYVPSRASTAHPSAQSGATIANYDALERVVSVQNASDSQTAASTRYQSYSGPSTQLQDEDGKQRVLVFDGLGRVVSVCEPGTTSDTPQVQNPQASPRCMASNIETDYSYDALGNLSGVQQFDNQGNSVARSFQYDLLSRLTTSNNPESGTVQYSYNVANGGLCSGDPILPCSITDARGVTRTFTYDTENRLTGKTYSDQTPAATFVYGSNSQAGIHAAGRLISESTSQSGQTLTSRTINLYDSMGRINNETQCVSSLCDNLSFVWDYAGNLRSEHVGSTGTNLTTISYHVNTANRADAVSTDWQDAQHPNLLFQETSFDPHGISSATLSGTSDGSFAMSFTKNNNIRGWATSGSYTGVGITQSAVAASAQVTFSVASGSAPSTTHVVNINYANGTNIPDSGALLLFVSSNASPAFVNYDPSSTTVGLAQLFANAIGTTCTDPSQNQPSGFVTAVAQNNQVILTDCPSNQSADNIRVQYAYSTDPNNSTNPSMIFSITGGGYPGAIQVSANGAVQATYNYQVGEFSPSDVALQLANLLQSSSVISGQAQGGALTLSSRTSGTAGNGTSYSLAITSSTGSSQFSVSPTSGTLTGGTDPGYGPMTVYSYTLNEFRPNGNLQSVSDSLLGSWTYSYDQLNRIQNASTTTMPYSTDMSNPASISWLYDAFGNRTQQSLSGSANFALAQPTSSFAGNRQNFTSYDASGNTLSNTQMFYDAEERLAADNGTGYVYNAEGNRVGKTSNGTLTSIFLLDASGHDLTEKDGSGAWRRTDVVGPWGMLATYDINGVHYFVSNWQGTRKMQANAAGVIEGVFPSLPFGDTLPVPPGSQSTTGASTRQFTGKERDAESGLDYFGARYYSSAAGRWQSPDWSAKVEPVPYAKLTNPQTLNLYAYVGNNPLVNVDADGHCTNLTMDGAPNCDEQTRAHEDEVQDVEKSNQSLFTLVTTEQQIAIDSQRGSGIATVGKLRVPLIAAPLDTTPDGKNIISTNVLGSFRGRYVDYGLFELQKNGTLGARKRGITIALTESYMSTGRGDLICDHSNCSDDSGTLHDGQSVKRGNAYSVHRTWTANGVSIPVWNPTTKRPARAEELHLQFDSEFTMDYK